MSHSDLDVIILAAGKGTRMRSSMPKVLHQLAGRSMLDHVIGTAQTLDPRKVVVVVGHGSEAVKQALADKIVPVEQHEQKGTGHAVTVGMTEIENSACVLVLYGDVPMVSHGTLAQAVAAVADGAVGLVTANFTNPGELGRIVRSADGSISRIVEFKDADPQTRAIGEINSGIMALPGDRLAGWLARITPANKQGEYYLTDVIEMAVAEGVEVRGVVVDDPAEVTGVNDRAQLAQLERIYQSRQAEKLMHSGVSIADPERVDIRGQIEAGEDVFIDINVVFNGTVKLGSGVHIGPGAVITDAEIGDNCVVHPHTVVEGAQLKTGVSVGPFARIRPGSVLEDGVKIGNFVETKKAHMGRDSKASHLAYLGDATIGEECNIGAGAVTCNYDGISKHETEIGNGVFVGTNATLVAPITIEDGAFVAAGSSVTTKIESGDLAVGRAKQRNIKGWTRPDQRKSKDPKDG
ncbi:MAG: bifunctional UDP-N-acetylglucosamine diphosphorylase/glucosamine-1-phosphate N-acetyltransferase GlmU [Pseudomonadota bacterium]